MARTHRERRRWTTTLAERMSEGPQGQPAHEVGAEVSVVDIVEVPGLGPVSISVARPSALLLVPASNHARKAAKLKAADMQKTGRTRWKVDGHGLQFPNEPFVLEFFETESATDHSLHTSTTKHTTQINT